MDIENKNAPAASTNACGGGTMILAFAAVARAPAELGAAEADLQLEAPCDCFVASVRVPCPHSKQPDSPPRCLASTRARVYMNPLRVRYAAPMRCVQMLTCLCVGCVWLAVCFGHASCTHHTCASPTVSLCRWNTVGSTFDRGTFAARYEWSMCLFSFL